MLKQTKDKSTLILMIEFALVVAISGVTLYPLFNPVLVVALFCGLLLTMTVQHAARFEWLDTLLGVLAVVLGGYAASYFTDCYYVCAFDDKQTGSLIILTSLVIVMHMNTYATSRIRFITAKNTPNDSSSS
ncbi:hypothetical protein ACMXYW_10565 [Neptuniibacter sp. QD48_55]|uniref:hypothetical protein n=1 Tax=Neptuniibacter sp. QD48_55 TaxID=3398212 RepID=UPI0039F6486C